MALNAGSMSSYPGASTPGAFPDNFDLQVTARGGTIAVGDVVMLDLAASDAATTSGARGSAASIFANVVSPGAAVVAGVGATPLLAVALTAAADDASCMVRTHGVCNAFVIKASGNIALFDQLTVSTARNCTADGAEGDMIFAIVLEAATAPSTRALASVYFDGAGMGRKGSGAQVTTAGTQTLTGKTLTAPAINNPSGTGFVISKTVSFTEDATSTTHTGTVVIPAGSTLHDIIITSEALWTATTSATLKVGDSVDDDGYFTGVDLKATDLLVGEALSLGAAENWGGKQGAYLVAATGRRGAVATNFGPYLKAGTSIIGVVTVVDPATTAGRTYMTVIYSTGTASAAVSA